MNETEKILEKLSCPKGFVVAREELPKAPCRVMAQIALKNPNQSGSFYDMILVDWGGERWCLKEMYTVTYWRYLTESEKRLEEEIEKRLKGEKSE
jgi:hypothetical protein